MAIQEFYTSRNNGIPLGNAYVGQLGRLWYDPTSNTIRVSDGSTPGGTIVSGGGDALPNQTGNAGKMLSTNGTTADWVSPPGTFGLVLDGGNAVASSSDFIIDGGMA